MNNDADQAERLAGKINEIMKDGLAHVFAADGVQSEVREINGPAGRLPNNYMIEWMLEDYIRRLNLVHRFEQEMSKYDALKEVMEQISYRG